MRIVLCFLLLVSSQFAEAQSSGDYARMSRASWSAFECSAYADVLDKSSEHERLFSFGYEQGKTFIEALRAGRVEQADLQSTTPSGFLMLANGPTADFALGRIFEGAVENALEDVFSPENILEKDLQVSIASRKYREANCEILGRQPQ